MKALNFYKSLVVILSLLFFVIPSLNAKRSESLKERLKQKFNGELIIKDNKIVYNPKKRKSNGPVTLAELTDLTPGKQFLLHKCFRENGLKPPSERIDEMRTQGDVANQVSFLEADYCYECEVGAGSNPISPGSEDQIENLFSIIDVAERGKNREKLYLDRMLPKFLGEKRKFSVEQMLVNKNQISEKLKNESAVNDLTEESFRISQLYTFLDLVDKIKKKQTSAGTPLKKEEYLNDVVELFARGLSASDKDGKSLLTPSELISYFEDSVKNTANHKLNSPERVDRGFHFLMRKVFQHPQFKKSFANSIPEELQKYTKYPDDKFIQKMSQKKRSSFESNEAVHSVALLPSIFRQKDDRFSNSFADRSEQVKNSPLKKKIEKLQNLRLEYEDSYRGLSGVNSSGDTVYKELAKVPPVDRAKQKKIVVDSLKNQSKMIQGMLMAFDSPGNLQASPSYTRKKQKENLKQLIGDVRFSATTKSKVMKSIDDLDSYSPEKREQANKVLEAYFSVAKKSIDKKDASKFKSAKQQWKKLQKAMYIDSAQLLAFKGFDDEILKANPEYKIANCYAASVFGPIWEKKEKRFWKDMAKYALPGIGVTVASGAAAGTLWGPGVGSAVGSVVGVASGIATTFWEMNDLKKRARLASAEYLAGVKDLSDVKETISESQSMKNNLAFWVGLDVGSEFVFGVPIAKIGKKFFSEVGKDLTKEQVSDLYGIVLRQNDKQLQKQIEKLARDKGIELSKKSALNSSIAAGEDVKSWLVNSGFKTSDANIAAINHRLKTDSDFSKQYNELVKLASKVSTKDASKAGQMFETLGEIHDILGDLRGLRVPNLNVMKEAIESGDVKTLETMRKFYSELNELGGDSFSDKVSLFVKKHQKHFPNKEQERNFSDCIGRSAGKAAASLRLPASSDLSTRCF